MNQFRFIGVAVGILFADILFHAVPAGLNDLSRYRGVLVRHNKILRAFQGFRQLQGHVLCKEVAKPLFRFRLFQAF